MENRENDQIHYKCPGCENLIERPYDIQVCGHILCKDCAFGRAMSWAPLCPGMAQKFYYIFLKDKLKKFDIRQK